MDNNKKSNVDLNILISALVSGIIFVIALVFLLTSKKNTCDCTCNETNPGFSITTLIISGLSLFLSISSWFYLIIDIRNSRKCKKKDLKKGGEKIALKILKLNPSKIIIIDGFAVKLFNKYILKHLHGTFSSNQIIIISKYNPWGPTSSKTIRTSKFVLDLSNLNVSQNDKIVFFEDAMFTGESIQSIYDYLVTSYNLSKNQFYSIAFVVDQNAYITHRCCSFYYKICHLSANYSFPWRA